MTLVADESVDLGIIERLRADGHSVVYAAELSQGISDQAVLASANKSQSPLLTSDKDFGEMVHRSGMAHSGVILFRLAGLSAKAKADAASNAIRNHGHEMHRAFTVVAAGQIRIRLPAR